MKIATDDHVKETIGNVLCETLQDFAFIFAEPDEDGGGCDHEPEAVLSARIGFTGDSEQGEMQVVMPLETCREMAANVLGADETEVSDEAVEDAIREWGNIVTGALVVALFGVEKVFTLSAPVAERLSAADAREVVAQDGVVSLNADDHRICGLLRMG